MKNYMWLLAGVLFLATACSGNKNENAVKTEEELIEAVQVFEDSLKNAASNQPNSTVSVQYADKCLAVYRNYPKSEVAPKYLDKAHVILSGAGLHQTAVLYADTLIRKYPMYENRPMVLQSLATAYDIFIIPRKKEMVKKYYTLLLKENADMPAEEKKNIQYRLDNIDLTFEQLIEKQSAGQQKQ